jgi:hypothetical protein
MAPVLRWALCCAVNPRFAASPDKRPSGRNRDDIAGSLGRWAWWRMLVERDGRWLFDVPAAFQRWRP